MQEAVLARLLPLSRVARACVLLRWGAQPAGAADRYQQVMDNGESNVLCTVSESFSLAGFWKVIAFISLFIPADLKSDHLL